MPWYVMLCAGIYALDTLLLGAVAIDVGSFGLLAIPSVLIKLVVMFVALAYWDSDLCTVLPFGRVTHGIAIFGTVSIFMEGYVFMKAVLMNPERSIADDNFAIIDSVLRRIVVPAVVLFFALRLIWLGHCAS